MDLGQATIIAAVIALTGAITGFISSQIMEYFRTNKESRNRQKERLIEKRIAAHELIMELSQDMIAMKPVRAESNDNFPRGPWVLESIQSFEAFYQKFIEIHSRSSTWLYIDTKRELNFCQDYLLSLYGYINNHNEIDLEQFSNDIRQDFINMSENLRKTSMDYLANEMPKLKFDDLNLWHKFKKNDTTKRIHKTQFMKIYVNSNEKQS